MYWFLAGVDVHLRVFVPLTECVFISLILMQRIGQNVQVWKCIFFCENISLFRLPNNA